MKLKQLAGCAAALLALFAGNAKADNLCQLSVASANWWEGTNPITLGQGFGYWLHDAGVPYVGPTQGPIPPPEATVRSVRFFGTGIGPEGEPFAASISYGYNWLGGFQNLGGATGTYERYAKVLHVNGNTYCTTNTISVTLQ